ncbi:hypothetical protein EHS25_002456 [Saitozyma podzolica]|uniref:Peptidase M20 dimerisation domain-containing protein n=1 Tax=Saitozyma podzolica TaxID=1890683 RepID=A0A427YEF6_9TREE|nr:hypothetical protein EHS25_002456 [Saitozyma podzolica]
MLATATRLSYRAGALRINAARLMDTLHHTCQWGATAQHGPALTDTGMCRLALSDEDKVVRDWFGAELQATGCEVSVDQMGNMFGIRSGNHIGAPTVAGSHLDTQPTGDALRTLRDAGHRTEYPVGAVNWTNEEGARFPRSLHGSSVWAGDLSLKDALALEDVKSPGLTAGHDLERIGYRGSLPADVARNPLAAHFELHIEQGPILEDAGAQIGVVLGGQAYRWFDVHISGRESHAGSTPLDVRADPLLCAARLMELANTVARDLSGVATTGILSLRPGSINTIPGTVDLTLDIRHISDEKLDEMEARILDEAEGITKRLGTNGCSIEWKKTFQKAPVMFHDDCVGAITEAAERHLGEGGAQTIYSGAGHDSCSTARHCPTGMIFIPCKDGISHNPVEYSTPEDCAMGAQVLLDAMLLYDSKRVA